MYLIIAVLAGMAAGFAGRGRLSNIARNVPSLWYLGLAGALIEVFLHFYYLMPPLEAVDSYATVLNFAGYLLILTMLTFNLDDAFTIAMGIGLSLNFIATFINGGFFPVSEQILASMPPLSGVVESIYTGTNAFYTVLIPGETMFSWLCVWIPVPLLTSLPAATGTVAGMSVGDILLFVGAGCEVSRMMKSPGSEAAAPRRSPGVYREPRREIGPEEELFFEDQVIPQGAWEPVGSGAAEAARPQAQDSFAAAVYGSPLYGEPAGAAEAGPYASPAQAEEAAPYATPPQPAEETAPYGTPAQPEQPPARAESPAPEAPPEPAAEPEPEAPPEEEDIREAGFPAPAEGFPAPPGEEEEPEGPFPEEEEEAPEALPEAVPEPAGPGPEPDEPEGFPAEEAQEAPAAPVALAEMFPEERAPDPDFEPTAPVRPAAPFRAAEQEPAAEPEPEATPEEEDILEAGFPAPRAGFPAVPEAEPPREVSYYKAQAVEAYAEVFEGTYRLWRRDIAVTRAAPGARGSGLVASGGAVMEVKVKRRGFVIEAADDREARRGVSEEEMMAVWESLARERKAAAAKAKEAARAEAAPPPAEPEPEAAPEPKPVPKKPVRKRRRVKIVD